MTRHEAEQAIASDLNKIDVALAFAKGRVRTKFLQHRKACIAQIKAWNVEDDLTEMSMDDLLAELEA